MRLETQFQEVASAICERHDWILQSVTFLYSDVYPVHAQTFTPGATARLANQSRGVVSFELRRRRFDHATRTARVKVLE